MQTNLLLNYNCRSQDIKSKKHHIPVVDRTPLEPPPIIVAVVGGPRVGKSTLVRCLIKNYTNQKFSEICGPVTIVAGKMYDLMLIELLTFNIKVKHEGIV